MFTSKRLVLGSGILCLVFLGGCHTTTGQTALVTPLTSTTSSAKAGEKEPELPISDGAKLCFATAESLEAGGKPAEAIRLYDKARHLDARLAPEATRRLAVLFDRSGEFDKALNEYQRGLQENPKDAKLLNSLGYGYYCRGEWAAAEANLRKAVAADPKFAGAWNNLGMTLAQQSKYDESLAAFGNAVTQAQAHCNLAFIQATQAKIAEAKQHYQIALQLEPGLQIARLALQRLDRKSTETVAAPPTVSPNVVSSTARDHAVLADATGAPLAGNR